MGDVTDLAEFRRRKTNQQIRKDLEELGLGLYIPKHGPSTRYVSVDQFREIFGDVPSQPRSLPKVDYTWNPMELLDEAGMKLRIIENRIKMMTLMDSVEHRGNGVENWKIRWSEFMAMADEYEHRANRIAELHWQYRKGCRPGQLLALREEKKAVGQLLRDCNNYWFKDQSGN